MSLILTNRPEPAKKGQLKIEGVVTSEENAEENSSPIEETPASPPGADTDKEIVSNGTLIVCPLSLMNQWVEEIKKHTGNTHGHSHLIYIRSKCFSFYLLLPWCQ